MRNLIHQDTYQVYCKGYLSEDKIRILTHLYQPLCRHEAIMVYITLYHEIERGRMLNNQATHYRLMRICQMPLEQFKNAILTLEGLGLLRTYYSKGVYIYELLLPLTPKRFFSNEVLNTLLYQSLGEVDYERTRYYFRIPAIDLHQFENITHNFDEVFHIDLSQSLILTPSQLTFDEDVRNEPKVSYPMEMFYQGLEDYRIPKSAITKEIESLIVSLGVIYHISPLEMRKLVYDVYENGEINKSDLQERCLRYYEFEHQTDLKKVHEEVFVQEKPQSLREQKIHQLKTLSPYQYLQALQNGANPTSRDLSLIEKLMTEQKFNQGVTNVLVETVLLLNNGQLPKNHLEYLAGLFARKKVQTVEQAMDEAKKYMAGRQPQEILKEEPQNLKTPEKPTSKEDLTDLIAEIQNRLKGGS